jgi:hypothetical protein
VVNRFNASRWSEPVPSDETLETPEGRKIAEKALYPDEEILALAEKGGASIRLWTSGCQKDVAALMWDSDDVAELVKHTIAHGKRLKPVWCVQAPTGPAAACDSFKVYRTEVGNDGVRRVMEYYVKLAIALSGQVLLIISCHTTEK